MSSVTIENESTSKTVNANKNHDGGVSYQVFKSMEHPRQDCIAELNGIQLRRTSPTTPCLYVVE
ncbi:hypothetical protein [Planctomicrobium sp. SH527]|uniref:hypothetical protein n=1 Tax=Planctomicrobium sp. SH527 TaxID=3448123 RepID=UPI003F5B3958